MREVQYHTAVEKSRSLVRREGAPGETVALQCVSGHDSMCTHDRAETSHEGEGMQCALFNQLQMPKPWRQHDEVW